MLESRVCVRFYHKIGFVAALCLMFLAFAPLAEDSCPSMIADWQGMQDVNVTAITGKIVFIGQSQT